VRYLVDECITNIFNYYTLNKLLEQKCSVNILTGNDGNLVFEFENFVLSKDMDSLAYNFERINAISKQEKRSMFVKTLNTDLHKDALGAGLGILTIRQKVNYDFRILFTEHEEKLFRFNLKINIKPD